ncbi:MULTISPECIES: hypothetical protein [Streptomyces]|uniref:Uncharacterized protein n=1 Tax=Streptomyces virginiae TaxID=1961 RepID=A0ABZ1TMJ3_STRVG|nr:hypothetical protein [Streptomyces virginiae]WTB26015.1 hypothetical protein OG253_33605 [Streptomyces virginiae]
MERNFPHRLAQLRALLGEAVALPAPAPHAAAPVDASGPALQGQERSRPQVWSA